MTGSRWGQWQKKKKWGQLEAERMRNLMTVANSLRLVLAVMIDH